MKSIEFVFAIIIASILLALVACPLAGLLMLGWNVIGVAALSIAVPISFLTALKGVSIIYAALFIRMIIRAEIQRLQMRAAMNAIKKEVQKTQNDKPDLMRHFR